MMSLAALALTTSLVAQPVEKPRPCHTSSVKEAELKSVLLVNAETQELPKALASTGLSQELVLEALRDLGDGRFLWEAYKQYGNSSMELAAASKSWISEDTFVATTTTTGAAAREATYRWTGVKYDPTGCTHEASAHVRWNLQLQSYVRLHRVAGERVKATIAYGKFTDPLTVSGKFLADGAGGGLKNVKYTYKVEQSITATLDPDATTTAVVAGSIRRMATINDVDQPEALLSEWTVPSNPTFVWFFGKDRREFASLDFDQGSKFVSYADLYLVSNPGQTQVRASTSHTFAPDSHNHHLSIGVAVLKATEIKLQDHGDGVVPKQD
jgi:hypothetical protein